MLPGALQRVQELRAGESRGSRRLRYRNAPVFVADRFHSHEARLTAATVLVPEQPETLPVLPFPDLEEPATDFQLDAPQFLGREGGGHLQGPHKSEDRLTIDEDPGPAAPATDSAGAEPVPDGVRGQPNLLRGGGR